MSSSFPLKVLPKFLHVSCNLFSSGFLELGNKMFRVTSCSRSEEILVSVNNDFLSGYEEHPSTIFVGVGNRPNLFMLALGDQMEVEMTGVIPHV